MHLGVGGELVDPRQDVVVGGDVVGHHDLARVAVEARLLGVGAEAERLDELDGVAPVDADRLLREALLDVAHSPFPVRRDKTLCSSSTEMLTCSTTRP